MLDLYSSSSNLGDNLSLTPLCFATPCRIHLFDDDGCRAIAPIFDHLAEVIFDNGSPAKGSPRSNDPTWIHAPNSLRHLMHFGFPGASAIPQIRLAPEELGEATRILSGFKNTCILKASPGKTCERTPPLDLVQCIVDKHPDITFLTFSLSSHHPKWNFVDIDFKSRNVVKFYDVPIRQMAAIFHRVGRYVGCDSGDYHLMLAVGGQCDVLVPDESYGYSYAYFHYGPECWLGEKLRVRYHQWSKGVEIKL